MFLAGAERILHADAQLGFHGISFPGMQAFELRDATRQVVEFMVARGVKRDFAERAFDGAEAAGASD